MGTSRSVAISAVLLGFGVSGSALGGFVDIGGGWAAEWDNSLDGLVDVVSNGVVGDAVFIQKAAQFTQGSQGGVFPSIPIVFRQIAADAVSHIVIDDEIIGNFTGETWTGFQMQLVDGGDAVFDPELTQQSGGGGPIGFTIDPFTTANFSDGDTRLTIGGGVLEDGQLWFPGDGATDGQLWIDVVPQPGEPFTIFTLKETPIPAPATLALLALAGLGSRRRRT